jgi:hypothetical protein
MMRSWPLTAVTVLDFPFSKNNHCCQGAHHLKLSHGVEEEATILGTEIHALPLCYAVCTPGALYG